MLVCPVCNHSNNPETEECKKCYWFLQKDLNEADLNLNNSLQKKWLNKLIKKINDQRSTIKSLKEEKTRSLDHSDFANRLHKIEIQQKQDIQQIHQEIKTLKEQIAEFKSLLNTDNSDLDVYLKAIDDSVTIENNPTSSIENSLDDFDIRNISNIESGENNNIFPTQSDRSQNSDQANDQENNCFNMTDTQQEPSLYNESGDRDYRETINTQVDNEPEAHSSSSYQSFYRLIKNGELEVIKVAVTQETMEKMRIGTISELRFSNDQKGNYWIINWHDVYCLIPKEKININQYQYGNFQRIFDCQNYQETYKDFEVIEPATVFNSDGETWQLDRKGKIKFI